MNKAKAYRDFWIDSKIEAECDGSRHYILSEEELIRFARSINHMTLEDVEELINKLGYNDENGFYRVDVEDLTGAINETLKL